MRVGADLLVRFLGKRVELALWQTPVLDAHLDREAEAAAVARADRYGTGNLRVRRVLLLLFRHEIEGPAEAGGVAGGEQVLRRGGPRLARPTHRLRHREVGLHHP